MSGKIPVRSPHRPPKPERVLYMMAKPPAEVLPRFVALPRIDAARPAELLHMTMLPFVDLAERPADFIPMLVQTIDGLDAEVFDVCFDRIVERQAVTLRFSKRQTGARAFQRLLVEHLEARDFRLFGKPPDPHVTISYRRDGKGGEAMAPVGWAVNEVILVESIYGKATHLVHGRWPLRRRLL